MPGPVSDLLARTATHHANAWRFLVAAGVVAAFVLLVLSKRSRPERAHLAVLFAPGIAGAAVGATLLPVLLRLPAALAARSLAPLLAGDLMAIGGLVGFAGAVALAARLLGRGAARALDQLAPSMGALVVFGRIGCFLEGCDFGALSHVPWAVAYPAGSHAFEHHVALGLVHASAATSRPVHPAQLYEAAVGLAMIGVALWLERRARWAQSAQPEALPMSSGAVFRASIATYAFGRLGVEGFRGDARAALGPLSLAQWLALGLVAWAAAGMLEERRATPLRG